jgi:hypothetical protein
MGEEDVDILNEEYTEENLIKLEKLMKTRYGK